MNIRGSEVQDFLRCRKRWDYRWNQKLMSKKKNDKLFFGTLFHLYLENYYKTKNHESAKAIMMEEYYKGFDSLESEEDMEEKLSTIADNYYEHWNQDFSKYDVVATELQFVIPLSDGKNFTGTIDLVVRDEDNNLWFFDHKTTNMIDKYEKNAVMDRQINRYWWALNQLAIGNGYVVNEDYKNIELEKVYGFIYNIILKDFPVSPKQLKSGGLSKDKSQKTTYAKYLEEIRRLQLPIDEYEDILTHLNSQQDRFFKRVVVQRSDAEIDATISEMKLVIADMFSPPIYRNITTDCSWDCQHKDLCLAEIDGSDATWLRDELYEKGEKEDGSDD